MSDEIVVTARRRPERRGARLVKQIAAGLLENTIADAAPKEGRYVPAIAALLPALVGIGRQLITGRDPNPQGDIFDRAYIGAEYARNETNRLLGTTDPEGLDEAVLRGIGGVLTPGFGIARGIGAFVAKGAQALGAGAKATKAARAVGEIATEAVLPLRNTRLATAIPVAGAVSGGLTELADAGRDDPNYLSIADTIGTSNRVVGLTPEEAEAVDIYRAERRREVEGSILNGRIGTIVATLGLGAAYLSRRTGVRNMITGAPPPKQLAGMRIESSNVLSSTDLLKTVFVDSTHPIRKISDKLLDPDTARRINNYLDFMTNSSIGARVRHMLVTGEVAGTNGTTYKFTPLAPVYEAMARELDAKQIKQIADAQIAATVLDDRRALGVDAPDAAALRGTLNADLEARVALVTSDPVLNKYYQAFRQSWDEMLDFAQREGLMDAEKVRRFRMRNPNYAELARSLNRQWDELQRVHGANVPPELGSARATEPGMGVQEGAVAQPFSTIPDRWASLIRTAQANNVRRMTLENLNGRKVGGKPIVERLPYKEGHTPDKMGPNEHVVYRNGKPEYYLVRDPDLNNALNFYPRVANEALNTFRELAQSMVTGPLATPFNLFALLRSPFYDPSYALMTAKDNVSLGLINNILQSVNPKWSLGAADPSIPFTGLLGGVKHAYESLLGALSTDLAARMVRENDWMRTMLGDETVGRLAEMFRAAYHQSTRAEMDRLGITSSTLFGASDPSRPVSGMEGVSSRFAAYQARYAYDEAVKGNISPLMKAVEALNLAKTEISTFRLVRVYLGLIDAMHNGVRNASTSASANKKLAADLIEFASNMRRLAPDPSIHGATENLANPALRMAGKAHSTIIDSTMYSSLGVQTLRNLFESFKRDPERMLNNVWLSFGPLMATYVYLRANMPEYDEEMRRTPIESKLTAFPLPGFQLPINPESAPILAFALPLVDAIAGFETGEINNEFVFGAGEMVGLEARGEVIGHQIARGIASQFGRINPYDPDANIIVNVGSTIGGLMDGEVPDMQTQRLLGQLKPAQTQEVTGLDADQSLVGDTMFTANTETALANIFGVTASSIINIMNEYTRAAGIDNGVATERALATLRDGWARGAGPLRPLLLPEWVGRHSSRTDDNLLMDAKRDGIEAALKVYASAAMTTPMSPTSKGKHARLFPEGAEESLFGTEMAIVAEFANAWSRDARTQWLKSEMSQLTEQQRNIRQLGYLLKPERQRELENSIAATRRLRARQMLELLKEYEVHVRRATGNPAFTWDSYNFTTEEAATQSAAVPQ